MIAGPLRHAKEGRSDPVVEKGVRLEWVVVKGVQMYFQELIATGMAACQRRSLLPWWIICVPAEAVARVEAVARTPPRVRPSYRSLFVAEAA